MMRAANRPPAISTLILLSALSVITLNMFLPSLPAMAADFGVSYARMSLAVSGYFALTAVLQLVIGPMSDKFGRRPVMLVGISVFVLASLACTIAPNADLFLAARVVQCAVVVGSALSPAIVRDTAGPADSARLMGIIGTVMALGPMLGPLAGGFVEAAAGWRATFGLYTAFGILALGLVWSRLGETNASRGRAFGTQFRAYPVVLRSLRFWSNALCLAFSASTFFVFLTGAPLVATAHFGMEPATVGFAMAVTPLGFMAGNFVTTRLTRRMPLALIMVTGRTITVAGLGCLLAVLAWQPPAEVFFGLMITVGIGNGLSFPPGYAGLMSVRPDVAGSASGLAGSMMVGLGAITTAVAARLLTPQNAEVALVVLMLASAAMALTAALVARRAEIASEAAPLEMGTKNP